MIHAHHIVRCVWAFEPHISLKYNVQSYKSSVTSSSASPRGLVSSSTCPWPPPLNRTASVIWSLLLVIVGDGMLIGEATHLDVGVDLPGKMWGLTCHRVWQNSYWAAYQLLDQWFIWSPILMAGAEVRNYSVLVWHLETSVLSSDLWSLTLCSLGKQSQEVSWSGTWRLLCSQVICEAWISLPLTTLVKWLIYSLERKLRSI